MSCNGPTTYYSIMGSDDGRAWHKIERYPTLEGAKARARGEFARTGAWIKILHGTSYKGRKVFSIKGLAPKPRHGWGEFGSGS